MDDGAHGYGEHPPQGSLGEEAARLAEAVQDWLGERTGRGRDVWAAATAGPEQSESPECRVCPLCRAMRFFTAMNPEVVAHLSDAAASFTAAVRAMGEPAAPEAHAPQDAQPRSAADTAAHVSDGDA